MFEWGGGYGSSLEDGTLRSIALPAEGAYKVLATDGAAFNASGRDDLVVWSAPSSSGLSIIRGFSRKRGLAESYASRTDWSLIGAALGPENLVVVGASGPSVPEGRYASVRLFWSKRPEQPSDVSLVDGPFVPVDSGVLTPKAAGDYAALIGCHQTVSDNRACTLHVAQVSTKKTWKINPRPGEMFAKLLAVAPTEVIVGVVDHPLTAISRKEIHRIVRFEMSKLDELSIAWP